jgi:hypothetical protein
MISSMALSCSRSGSRRRAAAALVLGPLLFGAASALAQEELDQKLYDGTWTARVRGAHGGRDATVVLAGYDGTWQERGTKGGCAGKKAPLTVQSSTAERLHFTVWGEKVGPTCPDLTIIVRPRGDKVLEGTADLGAETAESREEQVSHGEAPAASGEAADAGKAARRVGTAGSVRLTRR